MRRLRLLVTCLGFLAVCALLPAQSMVNLASVRGTVVDPAATAIVNARITIVNLGTNSKRTATTNQNGDYEFQALQLGRYRLTVVSQGFDTFEADDIVVESGETRRIDATMTIGQVNTKITVNEGAAVDFDGERQSRGRGLVEYVRRERVR